MIKKKIIETLRDFEFYRLIEILSFFEKDRERSNIKENLKLW
jgi:hypothetical protein